MAKMEENITNFQNQDLLSKGERYLANINPFEFQDFLQITGNEKIAIEYLKHYVKNRYKYKKDQQCYQNTCKFFQNKTFDSTASIYQSFPINKIHCENYSNPILTKFSLF